jgi:putative oxidoreductase
MMRYIYAPFPGTRASLGLLAVRLVAGSAMILHGWPKIQHPTTWMGERAEVPGMLQACAALAEFGGGICWVLGLLMPLASSLIAVTMAVALFTVHIPAGDPFVSPGGRSFEPALGYLAIAVLFLLAGPGRLSVDWCLFRRQAMISP